MKKIFIVGAGTMGLDIAQAFAEHNFSVVVRDISDEIINNSSKRLNSSLSRLVAKNKIAQEKMDGILGNIEFTTSLDSASDADLILEAIIENADIKKKLFSELDSICKNETVFATNTSSISITEIASATKRADRFIGMHFFNPANRMKLVEVIRGANTSDETFELIKNLALQIEKEPVEVAEAPGFVVNRILIPMINEAIFVYSEGIASAKDIDSAMQLGAGHPMGPLSLADFIGLDVCLAIMDTIYNETQDSKYRACPLLRKMVRGKKLGRKTKEGFFKYE